jgi:hypothetical protein
MASSMQPGKRYHMRQDGEQRFVDGYFLDNCFYSDEGKPIGDLEADGSFRFFSENRANNVLRYFYVLAGRVEGFGLVRLNGNRFDLVEVQV